MARCGRCDGCLWGGTCSAERLWYGEVLGDLHPPKGTTWRKEPDGQYWPDCCDEHRPVSKRKPVRA